MKTLAVLSALATIAIAAPTLEGYTDSTSPIKKHITIPQEREKKSIIQETLSEKKPEHSEDRATAKTLSKLGLGGSFGFKKPIIVKKKFGYHVYRDSDEELAQADSRESCKNQIKVKLCDDNNSMVKMKSDSTDHTFDALSESDIQESINMARVAVENFQKDLRKIEHSSAENAEHRHVGFGTDKELRDDIEKARQALEHIQRKIDSFDTVGRRQESLNAHLNLEKSDEERLAQWKEFVNNQKDFEISQNLEDNFKLKNNLKENSADNVDIKLEAAFDKDDNKAQTNSDIEENKMDDIMTSVTEGKKSELHSDSLKKDISAIKETPHNENTRGTLDESTAKSDEPTEKIADNTSTEVNHTELKNSVECKDHGNVEIHKHLSGEESHVKSPSKIKSNEVRGLDMKEKLTENLSENNDIMKTKADSTASDVNDHMKTKLEDQSHNGHLQELSENDEMRHESKQDENLSSTSNKKTMHLAETVPNKEAPTHSHENRVSQNLDHEIQEMSMRANNKQEQAHNDADEKNHMDLSRSSQNQDIELIGSTHQTLNNEASSHDPPRNGKFSERSALSKSTSNLNTEQTELKNHVVENHDNGIMHDHTVQSHLRATSDFHKEVLNNMEFVDDSHQIQFNKPSLTDANHMLKKENSELHERFNLPPVQPISNHLETMKYSSAAFQDKLLQKQQLKMASMFNNDRPNFNAQFNFPQTFEEQTNVQEIRPFKEAVDMHGRHTHMSDSMHEEDLIPSDLHDPLKVRWAHDDHLKLDKLKVSSQFEQDSMKMGGSSQHFTIDKSMPISSLNGQQMNFDDKLKAHQQWVQEKNVNTRKSMAMNSGLALQHAQRNDHLQHSFPISQTVNNFEQLHDHNSFVSRNNGHSTMMHGKSSIDTSMQPSSFMHMRESPKMAVEHIDHTRWSNNNAAFRSSYAPSMSASYGSGGIPSSGGSAVGLFPNANVGNCAVPLLLSCSPSVVSGSLAKANTYSAPSYRSEDINFPRKRNTDVGDTTSGVKVHSLRGHQPRITSDKKHI